MNTLNTRADVCTPKRPRRTAAPKLPYPDLPSSGVSNAEYWAVIVSRREAELAAFKVLADKTRSQLQKAYALDGPLAYALTGAELDLTGLLSEAKGHLANALSRAEKVPA